MSAMLQYPDENQEQEDTDLSMLNPIQQLFSDVNNGMPPAMSTAMFQHSIQSVRQLSRLLVDFFKHGLSYNQVEVSLSLARQFNFHRNYPLAMVTSLTNIAKLNMSSAEMNMFVELILSICKELDGARSLVTSSIVDIILQWTLPKLNKRNEIYQAKSALKLTMKLSTLIYEDSKNSFQFLYHQLRTRLLGASKSDCQEDCNYGNFCFETKSVLLDILFVLVRARAGLEFILEKHLDVDIPSAQAELGSRRGSSHGILEDQSEKMECCDQSKPKENKQEAPVVLLTPRMLEEGKNVQKLYDKDMIKDIVSINNNVIKEEVKQVKKVEVLPYQNPFDQILLSQVDNNDEVLGFLNSNDGDYSVPVQNNSCIGKDPRCSVILDGKDISRLHARIKQDQSGVKLENLTNTHRVRVNGSVMPYGSESLLNNLDVVQIGKTEFMWKAIGQSSTY